MLIISLSILKLEAQTIGLMQHDGGTTDNGYVLFSPINSLKTFLIDKCGKEIHEWTSAYRPGQSVYLLPDGNLLRTGNTNNTSFTAGGQGGAIEKLDWNSNVLWSYQISTLSECSHHDIKPLPNGNILVIVWELKTNADEIAAGRDTTWLANNLWSEKIIELQPTGTNTANIVWEWHVWDHLVQDFDASKNNYGVVSTHPELINLNYPGTGAAQTDWLHGNSIDYNTQLDQIVFSSHNFSELWVIDHSTTTAQAASHSGGTSGKGGDILYRWGNPQCYGNGIFADKKLFGQHNVQWITNGNPFAGSLLIFNNGLNRPAGIFSSIDIITTPVDGSGNYNQALPYAPSIPAWTYQAPTPTDFYASNISGAQIFENGNVQICSGPQGLFFEIDSSKNIVWKYINPIGQSGPMTQGTVPAMNLCFRAEFYPTDYSGFTGQTLVAGLPLELNPLPYTCELNTGIAKNIFSENNFSLYPNPATDEFRLVNENFDWKNCVVKIYDLSGREIFLPKNISGYEIQFDSQSLNSGIYFISVSSSERIWRSKVVIAE